MRLYVENDDKHVDFSGTLLLSKNKAVITIDNTWSPNNITVHNLYVSGNEGKLGRFGQLIRAFKFIYGLGEFKKSK